MQTQKETERGGRGLMNHWINLKNKHKKWIKKRKMSGWMNQRKKERKKERKNVVEWINKLKRRNE